MLVFLAMSLSLTLLNTLRVLNPNPTLRTEVVTGGTESTTTAANHSCGSHGSYLIYACICDPGYEGRAAINAFLAAPSANLIPILMSDQVVAFERFRGLPRYLGDILEIGAGPFTKTKLILENQPDRRVSHVTLLDPLIEEYIKNRKIKTSYPDRYLVVNGVRIPTTLIAAGGEDPLPVRRYDTVILVNTLEHCYNAVVVLSNAYQALKPGGILIFGESFAQETMLQTSDTCHPIQLMQAFLANYLTNYKGVAILPPRCGDAVEGVTHPGVKRTLFAILRKA
ncbi:SAM-dependent methyltransferase [Fragilaria crotonensis]|nr:SAM-dependent methyltransferase [Fragilaria crotonensis]